MSTPVEPSTNLWDATAELVSAGHQVLLDRVDLLRSEIGDDLRMIVIGSGLVLFAVLVGAFGWVITWSAVIVWLAQRLPVHLALLGVGGLHLVAGALLAGFAVSRFRQLAAPTWELSRPG